MTQEETPTYADLMAEHSRLRESIAKISTLIPEYLAHNVMIETKNDALKTHIKDTVAGKELNLLDVQASLSQRWHRECDAQQVFDKITQHITEEACLQTFQDRTQELQTFQERISRCLNEQCNVYDIGLSGDASAALMRILRDEIPKAYRKDGQFAQSSTDEPARIPDSPLPRSVLTVSSSGLAGSPGSSTDGTSTPVIWPGSGADLEELRSRSTDPEDEMPFSTFGNDLQDSCNTESMRVPPLPIGLVRPLPVGLVRPTTPPSNLDMPSTHTPWTTDVVTLIIRNIPARFTVGELLEMWPAEDSYNIMYLPYSHRLKRTTGIAFVNFITHSAASSFKEEWQGKSLLGGSKGLSIAAAEIQGFADNINLMRCSKKINSIRNIKHMPLILLPDGSKMNFRHAMRSQESSQ